MGFINNKRMRDYPRLMLISISLILRINLFFHHGWIGAFGQVIGVDFILFYKTGVIYRSDPSLIYDFATQDSIQKSLVSPSKIPSSNAFMNPPFVVPLFAFLSYISLPVTYAIWSILAIISSFISSYWPRNIIPIDLVESGLTYKQLVIVSLSFFPFIEGLVAGQNHWISLLLVSGILITMIEEKWYLSGIMAGLLLYRPQYTIGLIILWLLWKKFKALLTFGVISFCWIGLFVLFNGWKLFQTYSQLSQFFLLLPYIDGFPNYIMTTIYGLLTSIFPLEQQSYVYWISQIVFISCSLCLAWIAYKQRHQTIVEQTPAIAVALLIPLLATPYALLHDMVILVPVFVLWARYSSSRILLYAAITTYIGTFFLTLMGALTKFTWLPLLTIFLAVVITIWIYSSRNRVLRSY